MPELVDAYAVLGVRPDCTQEELKRAHRRLIRRHHPDLQPPAARAQATRHVQELNIAYGLVRDPDTRASYDELRREAMRSGVADLDAAAAAAWRRLSADAGRWAGRWWRRNRRLARRAGWRAQRTGLDLIGRIRWLVTCALWTFGGLTAALLAQDFAGVDGPFTLLIGGLGGLVVGNRLGWRARLRTAGLEVPARPTAVAALLLALGVAALVAGVWVDGLV